MSGEIKLYRRDPPEREPNPEVRDAAEAYMRSVGRDLGPPAPRVKADPETMRKIARAYAEMESRPGNPEVRAAYERFASEVFDQWEFVKGRVRVEFTAGDPYPDSATMLADVRDNRRLRVYTGGEPHPILGQIVHPETGESANSVFRAVHDYFGHAREGNSFGENGEFNAYFDHKRMFGPLAARALATETLAQNAYFNRAPANEGKPNREKQFAPQKAGLLPDELVL